VCSSCGKKAAARLRPGGAPQNPILFGNKDNRPAQPATLLVGLPHTPIDTYVYVSGDGVESAVEGGEIVLGYKPSGAVKGTSRRKTSPSDPAPFYVKTGRNKWYGFKVRAAAERYAKSVGAEVLTREEVVNAQGGS